MAVAQKIRCRVDKIHCHGPGVYTLILSPERRLPKFRAGQFLHLALDEYDPSDFWPESRVFSIASSPEERGRLVLSYSVKGRFTARMEKELVEGKGVWVKMPYGDFVISGGSDTVLFAGGTGITAFTAFLGSLGPDLDHDVYLAYGAKNCGLHIYRDAIDDFTAKTPRLRVFYFTEGEDGAEGIERGCLSVTGLWQRIAAPLSCCYYISGPPAMLKRISEDLRDKGVPAEKVRIDAWE
ncbi:MAG: FAD-dependent oxidoreductase [Smithellaceae bacterium]|nr:FAD-dependent oxidoreductase [Smithellaceae bacterium]